METETKTLEAAMQAAADEHDPRLCTECHHRPSRGEGCYCRCHDVADAAPALAEACSDAPVASKYHGRHGFEADRFLADYAAWRERARAALREAGL